jgi:hypothetical protein
MVHKYAPCRVTTSEPLTNAFGVPFDRLRLRNLDQATIQQGVQRLSLDVPRLDARARLLAITGEGGQCGLLCGRQAHFIISRVGVTRVVRLT